MKLTFAALTFLTLFTGCATEFMGNAHVDRPYCENYCRQNQLELTGMVALGEYSSGCVCSKPKAEKLTSESGAGAAGATAAAAMSAIRTRRAVAIASGNMMMYY